MNIIFILGAVLAIFSFGLAAFKLLLCLAEASGNLFRWSKSRSAGNRSKA
jgi:hypothetical protein